MDIMGTVEWFKLHWVDICNVIAGIIATASIIVKLTPTLKDDSWLLNITKFLSKYVALNTPTPKPEDRPK